MHRRWSLRTVVFQINNLRGKRYALVFCFLLFFLHLSFSLGSLGSYFGLIHVRCPPGWEEQGSQLSRERHRGRLFTNMAANTLFISPCMALPSSGEIPICHPLESTVTVCLAKMMLCHLLVYVKRFGTFCFHLLGSSLPCKEAWESSK